MFNAKLYLKHEGKAHLTVYKSWFSVCCDIDLFWVQDSISMLSSFPSSTTLYQEEDTVSLGAYSLQTPMELSNINEYNNQMMKPPS